MWKTIGNNGSLVKKTIKKPSTPMVPWQKPLTIPSCPKINHRYGLAQINIALAKTTHLPPPIAVAASLTSLPKNIPSQIFSKQSLVVFK